ncbi:hypothetical protein ACFQ3S_09515 [Mucilaginibacter terrae]|uniref:hypothetical protein n=1 Tax=Mucilaginibacter terrae TaxID=1955052 RepID=UPI00364469C3
MVNAAGGSDCSGPLGSLAYLAGTSYQLSGGYYPATRSGDFAFSGGYRFLFLFAEASAGYTISNEPGFPKNFFHAGPTLGIDLLFAQLNLGYGFRTKKSIINPAHLPCRCC